MKDVSPIFYEFTIPQLVVGRLIGRAGSFLKTIREKAEVNICVKPHPTSRMERVCVIEGFQEGVNIALGLIRKHFPENKYPQVTLEQVSIYSAPGDPSSWVPELTQLNLIEGVNNDVSVCHIIKPNRLFVHVPTHPTYPTLRVLDESMTNWYETAESPPIPEDLTSEFSPKTFHLLRAD